MFYCMFYFTCDHSFADDSVLSSVANAGLEMSGQ